MLAPDVSKRAEMPPMDHLTSEVLEHVYEPSDDTYLLIDTLVEEAPRLLEMKPRFVLEVGPGSGVVSAVLARELVIGKRGVVPMLFAVDVNEKACYTTWNTVLATSHTTTSTKSSFPPIELIQGDLLMPILEKLSGKLDVFVMNPPYVPTPSEEIKKGGIAAAWAGGVDGREVIDRCIPQLKRALSPSGIAYLLVERANRLESLFELLETHGLQYTPISSRRALNERLSILRISHKTP